MGEEIWKNRRQIFYFLFFLRDAVCIKHQLRWKTEEIQNLVMRTGKLAEQLAGKAAAWVLKTGEMVSRR